MKDKLTLLFESMILNGWFTESDGDVESPTGHFGYVTNEQNELESIRDAFPEESQDVADSDIVGSFVMLTNSDGISVIVRERNNRAAQNMFKQLQMEYSRYLSH